MSNLKTIVLVLVLAVFSFSSAQLVPDTECLDEELILDLVGCAVQKFTDLIPSTMADDPYETNAGSSRRLHSFMGLGNSGNYADIAMKNLKAHHKKEFKDLMLASRLSRERQERDVILEGLRRVDFRKLGTDYFQLLFNELQMPQRVIFYKDVLDQHKEFVQERKARLLCDLDPKPGICDMCDSFPRPFFCSQTLEEWCDDQPDDTRPEFCDLPIPELPVLIDMAQCLTKYTETDFEDGVEWLECLYTCDDLPVITTCMSDILDTRCPDWSFINDFIMRVLVDFLKLDQCFFKILEPTEFPIVLSEGGPLQYVEFETYLRPMVHCINLDELSGLINILGSIISFAQDGCDVQIQMSLSNYLNELLPYIDVSNPIVDIQFGRPKCRSGDMLNQAVIGWHDQAEKASCIINVTNSNWNATYRVPIQATVDHKVDGDFNISFTTKMVAGGTIKHTTKLDAQVIDNEPVKSSTCRSVNDPHITSFDGHYYNNYYDGYFQLYKNTRLPYEVQVIYQPCSEDQEASCNCAVAVRSGDDVFVVDKCRRVTDTCEGPSCPLMHTVLYVNGELTEGTSVYRRDGGNRYDVVLPHGTIVKIAKANDLLNVWVTPSPYDANATLGLCGTFNENPDDDLTMPDGSQYTGNDTGIGEQPRGFSQAWRVPEDDQIFEGAAPFGEDFQPLKFCKCHHVVITGVQCTCDTGQMVEKCDLDIEGEMTDELLAIWRSSNHRNASTYGSTTVTPDYEHNTDDIDMDEGSEPPEYEWEDDAVWNQTAAEEYCRINLRQSDDLTRQCVIQFRPPMFAESEYGCVEDIQIMDNTAWVKSAVEAARAQCWEQWTRVVTYTADDVTPFENSTCLYDCNNNGDCVYGKCECHDGFVGGDCSQPANQKPTALIGSSILCDTRHEHCQYATIYGTGFHDDESLKCIAQEATVNEEGPKTKGKSHSVDVVHIGVNQIACKLPTSGSHYISLEWNGQPVSSLSSGNQFLFMTRDTTCYTCDADKQTCKLKDTNDYCFLGDGCYGDSEDKPDDECRYCNISVNTNDWTEKTDDYCVERLQEEEDQRHRDNQLRDARIALSVSLTALVIILTVIAFICTKKHESKEGDTYVKSESGSVYYGNPDGGTSTSNLQDFAEKDSVDEKGVNNLSLETDDDIKKGSPPTDTFAFTTGADTTSDEKKVRPSSTDDSVFADDPPNTTTVSVEAADMLRVKQEAAAESARARTGSSGADSAAAAAQMMRIKQLAQEARQSRARSVSGSSVRSLGLGGGGPIHFGRFHPTVSDLEQGDLYGMGGHGTAGTPSMPKRMPSNASDHPHHHHHHHHHHQQHQDPGPDHTTHDNVHYTERL